MEPLAIARAELAVRGLGPIQDLVLGARLRSPRAGRFAAVAARRLAAIGAGDLGARIVADAAAAGADVRAAAWVDPEADDASLLELARDEGVERYLRRRAFNLLALRRRAERAFAEAARMLLDAHALGDGADDSASLLLLALEEPDEPDPANDALMIVRALDKDRAGVERCLAKRDKSHPPTLFAEYRAYLLTTAG